MADVPGIAFLEEAAAALIAGPLAVATSPLVHLAQAPFTPTPTTKLTDITEATFTGYLAKGFTAWGTPHLLPNGNVAFSGAGLLAWTPTDSAHPNSIGGWVCVDHAGNVVSCGQFNPPVPMNNNTETLQMVFTMAVAPWVVSSTLVP